MLDSYATPARSYAPGIGEAVANRTVNRKIERLTGEIESVEFEVPRRDDMALDDEIAAYAKSKGLVISGYHVDFGDGEVVRGTMNVVCHIDTEKWEDVARRVAAGNAMLDPGVARNKEEEFHRMHHHLRQASILMSGRHLQHGDETQIERNMEVFTNCLDASTRILTMEYGPVEIGRIAGETVTVIAGDGQPRPAMIHQHGEQNLFEITFRAVKGGGGKFRHTVKATANHRWKLRDGAITDTLAVGDVIAALPRATSRDKTAVVHGLVFGDGSAHKSRNDAYRPGVSQGRTYAAIRVCKQDSVADEIVGILTGAGYKVTYPQHANGDACFYIGKFAHAKELPFTNDPDYIDGFIYGWWLADGSKGVEGSLEISTSDELAATWLLEHGAYAGYSATMHRVMERKEGDGSFANGKALHVIRLRRDCEWKVESIEPIGKAPVFCPEEPVTGLFVLANGLLTGNCSTSAVTFLSFYLLLNGSGVGRSYDDAMMVTNWANMPIVVPVIDQTHGDSQSGEIVALDYKSARHLYAGRTIRYFRVPDSREGWAKAIEVIENVTWRKNHRDDVLILDFSDVRPRGAPIMGMQGRPASGPSPLMTAIKNMAQLRDAGMAPWRSSMYADHYMAECVLVGGARRAARMATKTWRDESVLDFIEVKRGGFLWSSNNSVMVDQEFWDYVNMSAEELQGLNPTKLNLANHAKDVFDALTEAAYYDGTGEPGLINADKLVQNQDGFNQYLDGRFAESSRYKPEEDSIPMMRQLAGVVGLQKHRHITNPCGEITLNMLGGYCVIADVVPFHAGGDALDRNNSEWDDDAEDAFKTATRALIRTNLMNCLYEKEVRRTNRIGVGITGLHEWIWARFGFGWKQIVNEEVSKSMWLTLSRFKRAIVREAKNYSQAIGVTVPHTDTTMKPAGCASLDTAIKTTEGVLTMRELFAKHGVTEEALRGMENGAWIEPTVKTMVLDEGNVEREVTKLYLNGVKPVYEIEFEDGTVVKLTGNHKLKTVAGEWKRVDELTESDEILQF